MLPHRHVHARGAPHCVCVWLASPICDGQARVGWPANWQHTHLGALTPTVRTPTCTIELCRH
eukprot:14924812-Alexandrium_andersonii.AAC.1